MAELLVPREQARTMLGERIKAAEDLAGQSNLADRTAGWQDWIFQFSRWRERTLATLRTMYKGDEPTSQFEAATQTTEHYTARSNFTYRQQTLDLGLFVLRSFVERLELAVEPEELPAPQPTAASVTPQLATTDTPAGGGSAPLQGTGYVVHGITDSTEARDVRRQADVLVITATEIETQAVLAAFQSHTAADHRVVTLKEGTYILVGSLNGASIYSTQSEMGAAGPGGSAFTVDRGRRDLNPRAIIMVGTAFGVDEQRQVLGRVLISQQIQTYELQKVTTDPQGGMVLMPRGDRVTASPRLLQAFRVAAHNCAGGTGYEFGLLLSGAKLINQQGFRDQLKAHWPEAIGGDMEGAGLYDASIGAKTDWIVVKAICDWADGNKDVDKHARQQHAARNAAEFVICVLKQVDFARY